MLVEEGVKVWRQDGVGEEWPRDPGGGHGDVAGAGRARDRGQGGAGAGQGETVTREVQRRRGEPRDGGVTRTGAPAVRKWC